MRRYISYLLASETLGGLILLLSAIIAMAWANSPYEHVHQQFIEKYLFVINDGLMSVFFLLVGLELKQSYQHGEYSFSHVLLPAVAAIGGMLVPTFIYLMFNWHDPSVWIGWATPVATDIAFAVGVLSLVGSWVPKGLRLFLLTLAIFDDIGAILIIAFVYTQGVSVHYLSIGLIVIGLLYVVSRYLRKNTLPIILLGICLWYVTLKSGIHPTISGVILALFVKDASRMEKMLAPWATFLIMPVFALANAGFSLIGITGHLHSMVAVGIALGLFLGKQMGVFGFSWLIIRTKLASMPGRCTWQALYGVSIICGIGFTMSLFLGTLSFQGDSARLIDVRLGVLIGSILSAITGAFILLCGRKR